MTTTTEAAAQFRKVKGAGIAPTHFDTHKHAHMFPAVLRPLLRAAQSAGIPAVRNPFAPLKPLAYAHLFRRPRLWTRYAEVKLLRHYATQFRRAVTEAGLSTTDTGEYGRILAGVDSLGRLTHGATLTIYHIPVSDRSQSRPAGTYQSTANPDVIISTVVGDSNAPFYQRLQTAGIGPQRSIRRRTYRGTSQHQRAQSVVRSCFAAQVAFRSHLA